jgi:integrase
MELTTAKLRKLTKPGLYGDGQNLYLQVRGPQQRSWLFRYMIQGRARSMGLGHVDDVSLVEARNKADAARRLVRDGVDPLDARAVAQARAITFSAAAKRFVDAHEAGWRCEKHRATWRSSLAADVEPVIGSLPVEEVDTAAVMRALAPIWQIKPETASRIRGRIEKVLSFATVQGWRSGPNPAAWRGHLQLLLPAVRKVRPMQHFAALDWREAPAFMTKLREQPGMGARALEFAILTAARSGEVRGATWDEIDLDHAIWTIPGSRMKAGKEHRVPLSAAAIALLQSVALLRAGGGLIFPSPSEAPPADDRPGADLSARTVGETRSDGARVPLDVPRLGGGSHRPSQPRGRAGASAHHRQRGGGCVSTRRPIRQTGGADERLGELLGAAAGQGGAPPPQCRARPLR